MAHWGTKSAADIRAGLREAMRQAQRLRAEAEDDPTDANLERIEADLRGLADEARDASDADTDDDLQSEIDRAVEQISKPLDVNASGGGEVDVDAHTRNGKPVSGYTRSKAGTPPGAHKVYR